MGGGKDNYNGSDTSDKGLFSNMAHGLSSGYCHGYPPLRGAYPPQGYPYPPVSGGYPRPCAAYPPEGYPPQGYLSYGHGYPPSGYPGPSAPPLHGGHGPNMGTLLAGGAATAAAAYGTHQMLHGAHHTGHSGFYGHGFWHHGKFKHGKFKRGKFWKHGKHGIFGHHGKFKKWK